MATLAERIEKLSIPEPNSGCWLWLGYVVRAPRYLRPFITIEGKNRKAHRVSFEVFKGPIPAGLYVCHTCSNGLCVNPDHLYAGTAQQNTDDMMKAGRHFSHSPEGLAALLSRLPEVHRQRREATHCKNGHPFSGHNLLIHQKTGKRRCRTCKQLLARKMSHG